MNEKIKRAWVDPDGYARTHDEYVSKSDNNGRPFFFSPDGIWHWGEIKVDGQIGTSIYSSGRSPTMEVSYDQYSADGDNNMGWNQGTDYYRTAGGHLVLGTLEDEDWQVEKQYGRQIEEDRVAKLNLKITVNKQEADMDGKNMTYEQRAEFYGKQFNTHKDVDVLAKFVEPSDAIEVLIADSLMKSKVVAMAEARKTEASDKDKD